MVMMLDTEHDARIARALQIRLAIIEHDMAECDRMADALLDEINDLAEARYRLTRCLWRVQDRLRRAAFDRQNREEVAA